MITYPFISTFTKWSQKGLKQKNGSTHARKITNQKKAKVTMLISRGEKKGERI